MLQFSRVGEAGFAFIKSINKYRACQGLRLQVPRVTERVGGALFGALATLRSAPCSANIPRRSCRPEHRMPGET